MGLFNKKELARITELEEELSILKESQAKLGITEYVDLNQEIEQLKKEKDSILNNKNKEIYNLQQKINTMNSEIEEKQKELVDIDEQILMDNFGLYKPKYDCMDSGEYAIKIKEVRKKQKDMIKNKTALNYNPNWRLDNSLAKGRALNNDNMKMVLRAFNNECDVFIAKAKFNNIESIENNIYKVASSIDKLNERNQISIKDAYLNLKLEELHLVHEYNTKKEEEKEELRRQREEEREEKKLQQELKEARKSAEKELQHYKNAKEQIVEKLKKAAEEEIEEIKNKAVEIDMHIAKVEESIKNLDYREMNKRAGYVYIISNIGSFGKDVYKIGMTRRLDPNERVDELGDASVPFKFDVHAMIFSDDAPSLETALHKAFENKKVNMINGRKEFFNVTLEEIEKVVKENHDKLVEFKNIPEAEQYRETQKILEVHRFTK